MAGDLGFHRGVGQNRARECAIFHEKISLAIIVVRQADACEFDLFDLSITIGHYEFMEKLFQCNQAKNRKMKNFTVHC